MALFALATLLVSSLAASSPPSVTLPQGSLTGVTLSLDGYNIPVNAFLGIPYAQPPVGDLRFRPPIPVNASTAAFNTTRFGFECPQSAIVPAFGPDTPGMSEDCLTLNVFQPTGVDLKQKKLPVGINIHGGAYNAGSGKSQDVFGMVSWSGEPIIGVSLNYRIGALGFLPSSLSEKEGVLNIGLKDQILAFKWVQENIAKFGGDPKQVTIFGPSAGGHSVGHHVMNFVEGRPPLFHRAIMEDGAPSARKIPPPNDSLVEIQFNEFVTLAGCANNTDANVFPCLREAPFKQVINASVTIYNKYNPSTRWPFQPVVDGEIIHLRPTEEWKSGVWNKIPILTGFATDEGSIFVPSTLNTSQGFTDFMKTLVPAFTPTDLSLLEALYPDPLQDPNSPYVDTRPIHVGSEFKRITAAFGQYAYICPVMTTARFASEGQTPPVYLWHWATNVSLTFGALHTSHTPYESYELGIRNISKTQDALAQDITAYWTSFIASGDPNKVRTGLGKDRPEWTPFDGRLMVFGSGNDERAGGTDLGIVAQMEDNTAFSRECEFWGSRSAKLDQ